jgi:hypothetical protein
MTRLQRLQILLFQAGSVVKQVRHVYRTPLLPRKRQASGSASTQTGQMPTSGSALRSAHTIDELLGVNCIGYTCFWRTWQRKASRWHQLYY